MPRTLLSGWKRWACFVALLVVVLSAAVPFGSDEGDEDRREEPAGADQPRMRGGEATERPVRFGEVFATLYQRLGIDVNKITLTDHAGRPQYLVPDGLQPMAELV